MKPETDVFDNLEAIRLPAGGGARLVEVVTQVRVRRPGRMEFVKTDPRPEMRIATTIFADPDERDAIYLVTPQMLPTMLGEAYPALLLPTVTTQGVRFVWPVRLPMDDGRRNDWHATALQAAELARERWIRVTADMSLGAYRLYHPEGEFPDPTWPEQSLNDLLRLAFRDRVIDREDHPVVRRLRGRA